MPSPVFILKESSLVHSSTLLSAAHSRGQSRVQPAVHRNGGGGSSQRQWRHAAGTRRNQGSTSAGLRARAQIFLYQLRRMSNNTMLRLKEKNKAGDILGDTEKTSTDKKRERRNKKKVKRLKIQERERRLKLKEATNGGKNKKMTKAEVTENLKKVTAGGKATILKVKVSVVFFLPATGCQCRPVLRLLWWHDQAKIQYK